MDTEYPDKRAALFSYRKARTSCWPQLHSHKVYEIYFLLSGQRRYFIDCRTYDVQAGDIVLIPPHTAHQTLKIPHTSAQDSHERYLLCPEEVHIPEELKACFQRHHYRLSPEDSVFIREELEAVRDELDRADDYGFAMYKACLTRILVRLARRYAAGDDTQTASGRRMDRAVEKVQAYVEAHAGEELTLSAVADMCGVTPGYLSAAFKAAAGIGFNEFLTKTRVAKSVKLLSGDDMSVANIALSCGFSNGNYFATVFKKYMGMTPTDYRNKTNPLNKQDDTL